MRHWLSVMLVTISGASAGAHHGYDDFQRDRPVTIQGTVQKIVYQNPHVVLEVRTASGLYEVIWDGPAHLRRRGVTSASLGVGDEVIVHGSPAKDQTKLMMALVTEVRRPADGWTWTRGRFVAFAR